MSGLQDSRVLSVFAQGLARPYMLGVEQRLTEAGSQLGRVTGGAAGLARLNHAYTTKTSDFSTSSTSAVDVPGLALEFTTYGGDLLLIATAEDFYVDTSVAATGEVGFGVDGGADVWVWQHSVVSAENDTYGLCGIRLFRVAAGRHAIKLRAKTNAGTVWIRANTSYPSFLMAVEL